MKNIIIMILMAAAFSSCQKEDIFTSNISENTLQQRNLTHYRVWFDYQIEPPIEDVTYGCEEMPGSCSIDIVITGTAIPTMNGIISTIINGSNQQIKNTFTTNRSFLLSKGIDVQDVDGVINGTETVNMKGTNPNQTRYMRFYISSNLDFVYPIRNQ